MSSHAQATLPLWADLAPESEASDWTFQGEPTRELTHVYHDYPARMIPQIAGRLLDTFAPQASLLFDPYCGTGTSLVEGMVRGINVIGTDLNPLARLIATAKTRIINKENLDNRIDDFDVFLIKSTHNLPPIQTHICGISRLDFWFKPKVIQKLSLLKRYVDGIEEEEVRLFFQVAFSETVRESSNTRNEEFKLYRYEPARLERFAPDVFGIMRTKLERNRAGLENFLAVMNHCDPAIQARVCDFNTVADIPTHEIQPSSVDIVLTSPPYGDSHTTVAYGQYSRLSAAWLGLNEPHKIDGKLMGGKVGKEMATFQSDQLNKALIAIKQCDGKRAMEVAAFYSDLQRSVSHVARTVKVGGHACYVVGNRKVKGIVLPTDDAVRSFFETHDFEHIETFHRLIPNKRMPLRNSPTNAIGAVESTMQHEHIVVMRRKT